MKFKSGDKVLCKIHLHKRYFERGGIIKYPNPDNPTEYKVVFDIRTIPDAWIREEDISLDVQKHRENRFKELLNDDDEEIIESWGYDERD